MTREEAVKKIMLDNRCSDFIFMRERGYAEGYVTGLEALGLIKFEEEKPEVQKLCSAGSLAYNFRVEQWGYPEDKKFVLWYNGEIVWRSWNMYA